MNKTKILCIITMLLGPVIIMAVFLRNPITAQATNRAVKWSEIQTAYLKGGKDYGDATEQVFYIMGPGDVCINDSGKDLDIIYVDWRFATVSAGKSWAFDASDAPLYYYGVEEMPWIVFHTNVYENALFLASAKYLNNKWDANFVIKNAINYSTAATSAGTWKKDSKGWWYSYSKGGYPKDKWEMIDGKWYHFDAKGYIQTGWLMDGGKWYYLSGNGAMVTGWQKISIKWYFFNSAGDMKTGWLQQGSTWYYLKSSGEMATGWQKISGKWYYFESSGAMLANTSKKINGKTYSFNASGVCTNP